MVQTYAHTQLCCAQNTVLWFPHIPIHIHIGWRERLGVLLLAVVYIEFMSGFLHIVFDNPQFQKAPFIGAPARDFQWRALCICHGRCV